MGCKICNAPIKKGNIYCSKACQYKGSSGSGNPMYRGAKLNGTCKVCGIGFKYFKGSSSGQYCSHECSFASPEFRRNQAKSKLGRKMSEEAKRKMSVAGKGRKHSEQWKKNSGAAMSRYYDRIGRKTPLLNAIRLSDENIEWKKAVLKRDEYACVMCGDKSGGLHVDHIIPLGIIVSEFKLNPAIDLFDIENGRTLCVKCHRNTPTFAKHTNKTSEGRLFELLRKLHAKQGMGQTFGDFYYNEMDKIISGYESKSA